MRILVVKLGALGDVVRTTSLLQPLRARYPGCRLWWATAPAAKPLLAGNPLLERTLTLSELRRLPRRERFDLVLSLEEDAAAAGPAVERCSGDLVGVYPESGRLRYTRSSAPYYDMSLLNPRGKAAADALKKANRLTYARLWLQCLGLPRRQADPAPVLRLDSRDRRAARRFLKRRGLRPGFALGLNPGAGSRWPAKALSVEKAARLAEALYRGLSRPVVLFGGAGESARNRAIVGRTRAPVVDAGTGHGLRAFAGLIEACAALVSSDTLAFHLAAALRMPAVVLTGPTSAAELDAFGRGSVLAAPGCSCFYRSRCRLKKSCLDRLPEERIVAAVRRSLG